MPAGAPSSFLNGVRAGRSNRLVAGRIRTCHTATPDGREALREARERLVQEAGVRSLYS